MATHGMAAVESGAGPRPTPSKATCRSSPFTPVFACRTRTMPSVAPSNSTPLRLGGSTAGTPRAEGLLDASQESRPGCHCLPPILASSSAAPPGDLEPGDLFQMRFLTALPSSGGASAWGLEPSFPATSLAPPRSTKELGSRCSEHNCTPSSVPVATLGHPSLAQARDALMFLKVPAP